MSDKRFVDLILGIMVVCMFSLLVFTATNSDARRAERCRAAGGVIINRGTCAKVEVIDIDGK